MRILILDDDDVRHEWFARELAGNELVQVHTYDEACDALSGSGRFDVVFLDHDLNDHEYRSEFVGGGLYGGVQELDGRDVAYYLANRVGGEDRPSQVVIHSWNPVGAKEMEMILRDAGFEDVVRWVFDPSKKLKTRK